MVERTGGRASKESPKQLFDSAQRQFSELLMGGVYDAGLLRTTFEQVQSTGTKAVTSPDQLYPTLIAYSRQAAQKAGLNEDVQTVGYFTGLADGFTAASEMLSQSSSSRPASSRSMTQAKS